MPERRPWLRRVAYVAAVMLSSAAFVRSLTGIATTQGRVRPDGEAAAAAKRLQQQIDDHRGPCHKQTVTVAPQRAV